MEWVYFMLAARTGRVKIGLSGSIENRRSILQMGSATRLRVIAKIPCGPPAGAYASTGCFAETAIHYAFDGCRVHGEWFELGPELRAFIRSVNRGENVMPEIYRKAAGAQKNPYRAELFTALSTALT